MQGPNKEDSVCGYYVLFHEMSQGVVFLAADGTVIDTNPAAEILFGFSSTEIKNRTFADLHGNIVNEDGSPFKEEMNPFLVALKTGQSISNVVLGINKLENQAPRWIKVQVIPRFLPGEKTAFQALLIIEDITEQKMEKDILQESEKRYRSVLETINEGVVLQAASGEILIWNKAAEKIFELSAKEVMGQTSVSRDWKTIREDGSGYEGADHPSMRTLMTGLPYRNEIMGITRPTGELRWIKISTNPIFQPDRNTPSAVVISFTDITELKYTEESLRRSEIRYRELFNNIRNGVAIYDVTGNGADFVFKDLNRAGELMTDLSRKDIIGRSIFDVLPDIENFGLPEIFRRIWSTGIPERYPAKMYHGDLRNKWYDNFVYRLPSGEIVAVFDDVTECKHSEQLLREQKEHFRRLFYNNMIPMGVWSRSGTIVEANDALLKLIGYTRDDIEAGHVRWDEITPPQYRELELKADIEVKKKGLCTPYEKEYRHKDGHMIPILIGGGAFDDDMDKGVFYVLDLTERKLAEAALAESELKYRRLFETGSDAMFLIDEETQRFIDINSLAVSLFGYSKEELLAMTVLDLTAEPEKTLFSIELIATNALRWLRKKDGSVFPVEITVSYFELAGKRLRLAAVRDITERHLAEEEVRVKSEHLNEVNAALRALLRQRDEDRKDLEENVINNIKNLALPYIESLRKTNLSTSQKNWVEALETNLNQVTSSFTRKMTLRELNLSNAELRVASLVRDGKSTKEIAEILMTSEKTVSSHRDSIRKKLGLRGKKGGLRYLLMNLE